MEPSAPNISGRILASAFGLLRDSLSSYNSQQASSLAHVIANEGKAGPSTASATTGPVTADELHGRPPARQRHESLDITNDAFREASAQRSINTIVTDTAEGMSFDLFIRKERRLSEEPSSHYNLAAQHEQICSRMTKQHTDDEAAKARMSLTWNSIARGDTSQAFSATMDANEDGLNEVRRANEVSSLDGADVVALLKDPCPPSWMDTLEEQEVPYKISGADKKMAEKFVCQIEEAMKLKPSYEPTISTAICGELLSLSSSIFDNIENYQEEVWGYLPPLIEEARLENAVSSSVDQEGPATRRLRMILAHINTSA